MYGAPDEQLPITGCSNVEDPVSLLTVALLSPFLL